MGHPDPGSAPSLRPTGLTGVGWRELCDLVAAAPLAAPHDLVLTGVTADSRLVHPGDLYVAAPGSVAHGADFVPEAIRSGAGAVLTDAPGLARVEAVPGQGPRIPVAVVERPRAMVPVLADRIYQHPATRLHLFGITGTNGKTTTAYLLQAALRAAGQRVGLIGTIGYQLDDRRIEGRRTTVTTPEAAELSALLAVLAEQGADSVVMEVSSHALALGRVEGLVFDVAAFTNFGSDHLDFHGDVASYFAAKAALFTARHARRAVINADDPRGPGLIDRARTEGLVAVRSVSLDGSGDYAGRRRRAAGGGRTAITATTPTGTLDVTLGLPGEFNVRNALTALAMADLAGVDLARAATGLADAVVPGRMQRVPLGPGAPTVFVDFAHTPQAVGAVLAALAGHRRVVVLGCGGDRDPEKRGPMGAAAAAGAEVVIVTDDNPRSEDPAAIRAQVLAGARSEAARSGRGGSEGREVVVRDGGQRRAAIVEALAAAGPDDVVAVLGKGHETGQEIAGRVLPFADDDVVREVWAGLSEPAAAGSTTADNSAGEGGR
ncbi:MAG TPA: UDP-N-acetylmuramoyl-L-alanyl-D-glutamate--2,6-diaminopimelate ligase [Candidatus Nanopelagicales bacterium]|nr:UDP-N-acetylmuramoyl-L-alanyl-D-glutamate--2,6-diaminopimelate ligase [Candidatus Nanopelagicales bacterium]